MSQNPNGGPNYDPYGPGSANLNYPPVPGTGYGAGQPPSGPNPYGQYAPPPSGPGDPTPNSNYGSPYAPPPPTNPSTPMPSGTDPASGPYGAYDPTVISQHGAASYPSYPSAPGGQSYPSYPQPGTPGGPTYPSYLPPASPDFNTPQPQKPQKGNARTILISVIALLIVVGGILGIVLYNNHQTGVRNADSTATSQTQVAGTAQAYTQATAHAQATATYVKSHYPFSSNLVLNDSLNNNSNASKYGWDIGNDCAFTNNTYQVTIDKTGYFSYCTASTVSFTNFTYEVQMSIQKGGNNAEGGVVFRANMTSSLFYVLYLSSTGYYDLDIQTNSNATNTRTLKTGTVPGFASGFYQVHTIGVVANGSQISLYVDQNKVTEVNDTTYSGGQIGVISAYGSSTTVVVYNNAKVWQL
jgi:hypothetical protein